MSPTDAVGEAGARIGTALGTAAGETSKLAASVFAVPGVTYRTEPGEKLEGFDAPIEVIVEPNDPGGEVESTADLKQPGVIILPPDADAALIEAAKELAGVAGAGVVKLPKPEPAKGHPATAAIPTATAAAIDRVPGDEVGAPPITPTKVHEQTHAAFKNAVPLIRCDKCGRADTVRKNGKSGDIHYFKCLNCVDPQRGHKVHTFKIQRK